MSSDGPDELVTLQQMQRSLCLESEGLNAEQETLDWMLNIKLPGHQNSETCMGGCDGYFSEITHVCRECCNYLCRFCAKEHMSSDDTTTHTLGTWYVLSCAIGCSRVCLIWPFTMILCKLNTRTHTRTRERTHKHEHKHAQSRTRARAHKHKHKHTQTRTRTRTHTRTRTRTRRSTRTRIGTFTQAHVRTRSHMHMCVCAHTHTQILGMS